MPTPTARVRTFPPYAGVKCSLAGLLAAVALAAMLAPPAADAAKRSKTITVSGKVTRGKGYTVVGLAQNGTSVSRKLPGSGRFRLRFRPRRRGKGATLHVIDRRGSYFGPVVLRRRSRRAFVSLSGRRSVNLGTILLSRGWAWVRGKVSSAAIDPRAPARASKAGKPIGAGKLGFVKARSSGVSRSGRDPDRDGIPGAFDVDDDGDLVLDNFERAAPERRRRAQRKRSAKRKSRRSARAAQDGPPPPPPGVAEDEYRVFSNLKVEIQDSINANSGAVSRQQMDELLRGNLVLAIGLLRGDSSELDCNGLPYCSKGGTGRVHAGPGGEAQPFPDAFDPDGDGIGTIFGQPPAGNHFFFMPGVPSSRVGSGDAFIQRVKRGGAETAVPAVLNYVFWTTPALVSISDGTTTTRISYPVKPGDPGTNQNPIVVTGSPDVLLTLTLWRPQRQPLSGEGSRPVDLGHLRYSIGTGPGPPEHPILGDCPQPAYSTSDPNLSPAPDPAPDGAEAGLVDRAGDQPADRANMLSLSVNLTRCQAAHGATWSPGEVARLDIAGQSQLDNAAQAIYLRRG